MAPDGIPPVNKRLCRGGAALAGVTAQILLAGNAAMWLVPQWTEMVARNATNLWTEQLFIAPLVRWLGLGITTLQGGVLVSDSASLSDALDAAGVELLEASLVGTLETLWKLPDEAVVRRPSD